VTIVKVSLITYKQISVLSQSLKSTCTMFTAKHVA